MFLSDAHRTNILGSHVNRYADSITMCNNTVQAMMLVAISLEFTSKFCFHHTCETLNPKTLHPKPLGNTWCTSVSIHHQVNEHPFGETTSEAFVNLITDDLDDYAVQVINLKQEISVHFNNETNWMDKIWSLGLIIPHLLHLAMHRTYPKSGVQKQLGYCGCASWGASYYRTRSLMNI